MLPLQGGAAEYVATQLDVRLREHLKLRSNLLNEGAPGLAASLSRPLLCLFDRSFELSVVSPIVRLWCQTRLIAVCNCPICTSALSIVTASHGTAMAERVEQ